MDTVLEKLYVLGPWGGLGDHFGALGRLGAPKRPEVPPSAGIFNRVGLGSDQKVTQQGQEGPQQQSHSNSIHDMLLVV